MNQWNPVTDEMECAVCREVLDIEDACIVTFDHAADLYVHEGCGEGLKKGLDNDNLLRYSIDKVISRD